MRSRVVSIVGVSVRDVVWVLTTTNTRRIIQLILQANNLHRSTRSRMYYSRHTRRVKSSMAEVNSRRTPPKKSFRWRAVNLCTTRVFCHWRRATLILRVCQFVIDDARRQPLPRQSHVDPLTRHKHKDLPTYVNRRRRQLFNVYGLTCRLPALNNLQPIYCQWNWI